MTDGLLTMEEELANVRRVANGLCGLASHIQLDRLVYKAELMCKRDKGDFSLVEDPWPGWPDDVILNLVWDEEYRKRVAQQMISHPHQPAVEIMARELKRR